VISVIYRHPAPQYDSTKELENILHNISANNVTYDICGDLTKICCNVKAHSK